MHNTVEGEVAGPFTRKFDERVAYVLDRFHVPGISISVVDGERTFAKLSK